MLKVNTNNINKNNLKVYLNNLAFNNFKKCETNNFQPEFKNKTRMIYSTIIEIIKAESLLVVRNESNQTHQLTNDYLSLSTKKLFKSNKSLQMPKPSTVYDIFNLSNVNLIILLALISLSFLIMLILLFKATLIQLIKYDELENADEKGIDYLAQSNETIMTGVRYFSDESLLIDYNRNELYKAFKLFKLTTSKKNETNNTDKNNNNNNIETLNL